jgi:hypothetical protein
VLKFKRKFRRQRVNVQRSIILCNINNYAGDNIEKNEMGGASSSDRGKRQVCTGFWWENLRVRDHLEDPDIDGRITLKWICKKWDGGHGL